MGSLLDLLGAHSSISLSSPSTKSSSRSRPGRFDRNGGGCRESSSVNSSSARLLDLMSSEPGSVPCSTNSRIERASSYRACFIRQRPRLQALLASGSIIWAFRTWELGYLVQVDEDVIKGFLGLFGAKAPERLDRFNGLLSSVQLLHHHRHVLKCTIYSIACIYGLPK
ncbi:hypothetical protein RJ639_019034 [Escallonia herrerae]|uniref:Uncharacterized protein n=1 Tax=Escallonia herrerae TaxID=1293975 RepID=A0AA88VBA6_9ASTE|nr:hypothetical protein RJ639_019034 [Escallonia herrerae]